MSKDTINLSINLLIVCYKHIITLSHYHIITLSHYLMSLQIIQTSNAPLPAGHYSQATVANGFIFVAGQLPIKPITKEKVLGSIEEQTLQTLENVKAIVEAAGSDLNHVAKVTIYISDISLWDGVNKVYTEFFGAHKPARAIVPVKDLHYGFLIEIEAVAVLK
jgi:2-iminobutanoate/2-iminopropanoate deaminase